MPEPKAKVSLSPNVLPWDKEAEGMVHKRQQEVIIPDLQVLVQSMSLALAI